MSGVSRFALHSFFHAHMFYNSEQISQRFVKQKKESCVIPDFSSFLAQDIFENAIKLQIEAYFKLCTSLFESTAAEYYRVFPARLKKREQYDKEVQKKVQEVARYVLPIGTMANLYHTISLVTLIRYHATAQQPGASSEVRSIVNEMVKLVCDADPKLTVFFTQELLSFPELKDELDYNLSSFRHSFDKQLAGRSSLLIDYSSRAQLILADSVMEVLGQTTLSTEDAIDLVLNPAKNTYLAATVNNNTMSPLMRTLQHVNYTFKRKISHAADSQDQRHRMVPGSRPVITYHFDSTPDYYVPELIKQDSLSLAIYTESMHKTWEAITQLLRMSSKENVAYLLPNAFNVRYTETGNLLNLHHKWKARLCYNAQEEIWKTSLEEVQQIAQVHPLIGNYILPPCGLRKLGGVKPYCPEGSRYCGVPVWSLNTEQYQRLL